MRAGRKDSRIQLQKLTTARSATGEESQTWQAYKNVWAEVTFEQGGEQYESGQIMSEAIVNFKIDYLPALMPKLYRVKWNNLIYDIRSPSIIGRNEALKLVCVAQALVGGH